MRPHLDLTWPHLASSRLQKSDADAFISGADAAGFRPQRGLSHVLTGSEHRHRVCELPARVDTQVPGAPPRGRRDRIAL